VVAALAEIEKALLAWWWGKTNGRGRRCWLVVAALAEIEKRS